MRADPRMSVPRPKEGGLSNQPLWHQDDDNLGHWRHARALASAIASLPTYEPRVIAVTGRWGAGKTTFLNFLEHFLMEAKPRPMVARATPWWHARSEEAVVNLLAEMGRACRAPVEGDTEVARRLASAAALAFFALSIAVARDAHMAHRALLAAKAMTAYERAVLWVRKTLPAPPDIRDTMDKWGQAAQGRRFVVLVDDLDRLQPHEVYDVLTTVRAALSLPYTIFVLALDPDHTAQALATHVRSRDSRAAREYLEKFFDAMWPLPPLDQRVPARMIRDAIFLPGALDPGVGRRTSEPEAGPLLESLFDGYIPELITSVRDAARIYQQFRLRWQPGFRSQVGKTVFLALTVIEIVSPSLHQAIGEDIRAITPEAAAHGEFPSAVHIEAALSRHGGAPAQTDVLRRLVEDLFPPLRPAPLAPTLPGRSRDLGIIGRGQLYRYFGKPGWGSPAQRADQGEAPPSQGDEVT